MLNLFSSHSNTPLNNLFIQKTKLTEILHHLVNDLNT